MFSKIKDVDTVIVADVNSSKEKEKQMSKYLHDWYVGCY